MNDKLNTPSRRAYQLAKEMGERMLNEFIPETDPEQEKRSKELAVSDLEAITYLKGSTAFMGYFMRRVQQKANALENQLKYAQITPEERESVRQRFILLEDMQNLLSADEAQCKAYLSAPHGPNGLAQ